MDTTSKLIAIMAVATAVGSYVVYDLAGNVLTILMEASK